MKKFLLLGIRSIFSIACATLAFIATFCILIILGALTAKGYYLTDSLRAVFQLLLLFLVISIPLGFFIGAYAKTLKGKRIFIISYIGYAGYWILIVLVTLILSRPSQSENIFIRILTLSLNTMLAYSFYLVPVVISATFFIGKRIGK